MFDNIYQQNLADLMKAHILRIAAPSDRRQLLNALQGFERSEWFPDVFEDIARQDNRLTFDGQQITINGDPREVLGIILEMYEEAAQQERKMTLKDAQKYLVEQGIVKADGEPYTLIALKKAVERGVLKAYKVQAPTPYYTVTITSLMNWVKDTNVHQPGRKPIQQ